MDGAGCGIWAVLGGAGCDTSVGGVRGCLCFVRRETLVASRGTSITPKGVVYPVGESGAVVHIYTVLYTGW